MANFLRSSRYFGSKIVSVPAGLDKCVRVVALRKLPETRGIPFEIQGGDRLDLMSEQQYEDSTRFWHIADSNSELDANDLTLEVGRKIQVPELP